MNVITPEKVEISLGTSGATLLVARFWYYTPRVPRNFRNGIRGNRLNEKEVDRVSKLYKDFNREDLFVWLSPKIKEKVPSFKIDISKLDPKQLRQPSWSNDLLYRGDIFAQAIKNIAYPETISEQDIEIVELLKRNCGGFLKEWDKTNPLFANILEVDETEKVFFNTSKILLKKYNTNTAFPNILGEQMQESGFVPVTNSSIVSGKIANYVVIPLDGYKYCWSNNIKEHMNHLLYYKPEKEYPNTTFGVNLKLLDYWKNIEKSYRNDNLNEAISSKHEILLSGKFYAIETKTFANIVKHGLLEEVNFRTSVGQTLQYWYNVFDQDIVYVSSSNEKSHSETVLENPERFEIDSDFITDEIRSNVTYNGYDAKLMYEMFKLGWVRIDYDSKEISIEGISEKNIHKALRAVMAFMMEPFRTVIMDVRHGENYQDQKWSSLSGARLDYFLNKGIVPSGMVRESIAPTGKIQIFRGEYSGNKGGNFWTTDKEFARQFTQSGLNSEILVRYIWAGEIYRKSENVYAGNTDAVDEVVAIAKEEGYKAVLLDEGIGQPKSIYVFDKSGLMR